MNRKTRQTPIVLDNPFVNVVGCLPPDLLGQLTDARGREDGFVHRLLFGFPDPLAMHWSEVAVREATLEGYCRVFEGLWALQGVSAQKPRVVPFTPTGRQTFIAYANALYAELADPDCPDTFRGPLAKLEGYGARLALLVQLCRMVCEEAHGEAVDECSVRAAAALLQYFKSHARRVSRRLQATPTEQRVARALHWLETHPTREWTLRQLLRAKVGGCTTRQEMERLLGHLADRGWGYLRHRRTSNGMTQTIFVCEPSR